MQIEVYFRKKLLGTATTVDGKVVFTDQLAEMYSDREIPELRTGRRLTVNDGDRYIRGMIDELNNGYMRTVTRQVGPGMVILSDGQDPLKAAAAISGMSIDALEHYRGMSLEQVQAERARLAAERVHKQVIGDDNDD